MSRAILAARGMTSACQMPDFSTTTWGREHDPRWELIGSLTMWFIWRAQCCRLFESRVVPPAETIRNLWLKLIHMLRG
eukprot:c36882_g1_i1 orf=333-566(+)